MQKQIFNVRDVVSFTMLNYPKTEIHQVALAPNLVWLYSNSSTCAECISRDRTYLSLFPPTSSSTLKLSLCGQNPQSNKTSRERDSKQKHSEDSECGASCRVGVGVPFYMRAASGYGRRHHGDVNKLHWWAVKWTNQNLQKKFKIETERKRERDKGKKKTPQKKIINVIQGRNTPTIKNKHMQFVKNKICYNVKMDCSPETFIPSREHLPKHSRIPSYVGFLGCNPVQPRTNA